MNTNISGLGLALLALAALALILAPTDASAHKKDNPNYGFCKSGKQVADVKECKEYGGKS